MPTIGTWELVLIFAILILILGVDRVTGIGKELGKMVREIRGSRSEERRSSPTTLREQAEEKFAASEELVLAGMLAFLLDHYGFTPYKLAERAGVDRSTAHRLLTGETKKPQESTVNKILDAFSNLDPEWRKEFLTEAGYPPTGATRLTDDPLKVYLSCHGSDLTAEREAVAAVPAGVRALFTVKMGNATWSRLDAETEVTNSDYLVMVQGWRWVQIRRTEYRTAEKIKQVIGLYFQKQGPSPRSDAETESFVEEVGTEKWEWFDNPRTLSKQVWHILCETTIRHKRMSLSGMSALYLTSQLLSTEYDTLSSLLQSLATKGEDKDHPMGEVEEQHAQAEEVEPQHSTKPKRQGKIQPLEPEMVMIPTGSFLMGTERLELEFAGIEWESWMERETPQHRVRLPAYEIGKYPVSNAEFARFIEDGGYRDPFYWTSAGWDWRERNSITQPTYWKDEDWNSLRQPAVGVSWYEAIAYCNWLSERTGKAYGLPSEAEWEKAARGTDGRIYPWGDELPDETRCNFAGSNVGKTTPVGRYSPRGDGPYDCADIAGNVWEWTRSLWGKSWGKLDFGYPYDPRDGRENLVSEGVRVLRGGSFIDHARYVRCAFRLRDYPYDRYPHLGFRVVASPVRSDL